MAAAGSAESESTPGWEAAHPRLVSSYCRRPCRQPCPWPLPPSWRAAPTFPSLAVQRGTPKRRAPPARCWADSPPRRARRPAVRGRPAMRRADRPRSRRSNRRPARNRTGAMRVLLQVSGWSSCRRLGPAHRSCGGAPALDQPQAQSSLRISSTMARPWSSPRHCAVKENLSMNEVLNAQARFWRTVLQAFVLELGGSRSRVISYVAVDSSAAAAIDVQVEPHHIASARRVRARSGCGPPHSDFGPIQKGPGTARLPGDETGLPRKAGRTRDAVLG